MSKSQTRKVLHPFLGTARGLGEDVAGATMVEYGLIAAFIVMALVGILPAVGNAVIRLPFAALLSAFANALS